MGVTSPLIVRYMFMLVHFGLLLALVTISLSWAIGAEAPDIISPMVTGIPGFSTLHYLIPAAILCAINRESRYERGWVEVCYLTYQILFSICAIIFSYRYTVVRALAITHTVVLVPWFFWTLWLATCGAKLLGSGWTRDLVLRKVSMSKLVRLSQPKESQDVPLDKLDRLDS